MLKSSENTNFDCYFIFNNKILFFFYKLTQYNDPNSLQLKNLIEFYNYLVSMKIKGSPFEFEERLGTQNVRNTSSFIIREIYREKRGRKMALPFCPLKYLRYNW